MRHEAERGRSAWDKARLESAKIKLEVILQEADMLFTRKGYNATSLDDIASRLNVTKTALYHYVKNKNELLCRCYLRSIELTEKCYDQADLEGKTGLEKIIAYLRIDASSGVMSMTPLMELDAIRDAKMRQKLSQRLAACEARLRGFIEVGIKDGSIRPCDPELTALFILGASRHILQWYNPDVGHDLKVIVERFIEFCKHGLLPTPAT
ncbi:MAG TPA: TetR/AcrR family transcriptional regulator [Steroidobacter sp.]|uniref:TetR/AcrR family transcriptional regulator n=1 Tax=Steroidobacter sp. TaxID=1978227 RepID=UPI002ED98434